MSDQNPIIQTLKTLPKTSGIYQYFDHKGRLLYVGKAKNLYNRVRSYFKVTDGSPSANLSPRITHMVSQIHSIQTLIVANENDALILENSLIKQLKPKYNILLRDDKTYPYIFINLSDPFPRPQITRSKKGQNCLYFGPFCSGAREILDSLYELFALVQKNGCLREKKACLFYQINRCKAPCEGKISQEDYGEILKESIIHLKNTKLLITRLEERMHTLASQERFEEALILRDRIKKISMLKAESMIDLHIQDANWDVFAISYDAQYAALVKLYMREGKIISSDFEKIPLQNGVVSKKELLSLYQQAILSHYSKDLPILPKAILLPQELSLDEIAPWQEWLGAKIKILIPQRGDKANLTKLALLNAQEILKNKNQEIDTLLQIQKLFSLQCTPHRIEIFDTSHHGGEHNVGAMVVYENQKWIKSSYRHYNLEGSDEYSQMREMLVRRAQDFSKDSPPDLWILDGGVAQINIAQEVLESVGVHIDVIAIAKEKLDFKAHRAKGRAKDMLRGVIEGKVSEFALLPSDVRLQFCQKLRDEAHRFAISFHRQKKLKSFIPKV
ncbi:excinuclease ABC subunit UvrC [Helicobacter pametensis]|uniref:excinuclease ABC subunit UvrC n=1 Tax=Helicobacter pametensis TaxID=95149 RepID=UPI0004AF6F46|nr:excinuclease ABC subunit UvrC [Helicobacter pametensis]